MVVSYGEFEATLDICYDVTPSQTVSLYSLSGYSDVGYLQPA